MADMADIIARYGGARRSGNTLIFQRGGRDAGEFTELRQLGQVRVTSKEILVDLTRAERKAKRIKRDVGAAQRSAALVARQGGGGFDLPNKSTRLSRKARARALGGRSFGVNSESVALGAFRLGRSGMTANRTFLSSGAGTAMTAALGLHLVGAGLQGHAELKAEVANRKKEGATRSELIKTGIGFAGKSVTKGAADLFGVTSVTTGIGVAFKGLTKEDAQAFQERQWARIFDSQESLDRKRRLRQNAITTAGNQAVAVIDETWRRIGQYRPQGFRLKGSRELQVFKADINKSNREMMGIRESALRSALEGQADMALPEVP